MYHVETVTGRLSVPPSMDHWVKERFGRVDAVIEQRIAKVTNLVTMEGALFNPLRAVRPTDLASREDVSSAIESTRGGAFCQPERLTPEDLFHDGTAQGVPGRIQGDHCVTASNIAKYDGYHGLVIFDEHNPLCITTERVRDYLETALRWAERAHATDAAARYFFLMWNCLWKGGASIVHGHMQVTLGRGMHYARIEHWRRQALQYRRTHGANYFDDLFRIHEALGLAVEVGETRLLASLTPVKEKEVLIVSPTPWLRHSSFVDAIGTVLQRYVTALGVQSFNMVLYQRPIDDLDPEVGREEDWRGFPAIVRMVDRGDLESRTVDVGCMELYGSSVIATDPCDVIRALRCDPRGL
jgi:galactose-1-phosphate uridylyltransferase